MFGFKKKDKKKKKKTEKRDYSKRTGTIPFKGENLKVTALNYEEEDVINGEFGINTLTNKMMHYNNRVNEPNLDQPMYEFIERELADITSELYYWSDVAATFKLKKMIKKPEEWFESLDLQDMIALKNKVMSWQMYVEMDELYMEIFREASLYYGESKTKTSFTGAEIYKYLIGLERDYLSLKKKSKCLDTAIQNASTNDAVNATP